MSKINVRDRNKNTGRKPNWEYRFEVAPVNGKRQSISKSGFKTKKDALEAGAKAMANFNPANENKEWQHISVQDFLEIYIEQYCKINFKYNTYTHYSYTIKKHINPAIGKYYLNSVTPILIQNFINELAKQDYTVQFFYNIIGILRGAFAYAIVPLNIIKSNPAQYVKIPKHILEKQTSEKSIITPKDFEKILKFYPEGTPYHMAYILGLFCGMRGGEVFGLLWEDIDFDNKTLTILRQYDTYKKLDDDTYYVRCSLPKYGSTRRFPISDYLVEKLRNELQKQKRAREALPKEEIYKTYMCPDRSWFQIRAGSEKKPPNGSKLVHPVMVADNGRALLKVYLCYMNKAISKKIGKHFSFHCLRHTASTMMYENGVPIKAIQQRLGHKNINTTLGTYTHNTDKMAIVAANALDDIFINTKKRGQTVDKNKTDIPKTTIFRLDED